MSRSHAELTPVLKAAIDWMVLLDSGSAKTRDRAAFEGWLAADAGHRLAWESLNGALAPAFTPVVQADRSLPGSARAATQALRSSGVSLERRRLLRNGSALALLLGLGTSIMLQRRMPLQGLVSDIYSGTAERKQLTLPDGSVLLLNARTTVDLDFSTTARRLRLHQGELRIQVAADPLRPLQVVTAQGSVQALGTCFSVRQLQQETLVGVQQHSVRVMNLAGQQAQVNEGGALRFSQDRLLALPGNQHQTDAWVTGRLEVENESLGSVIEALRPYRYGLLRISEAASRLRVFGVFSLDDSDRALQSLAQVLPITVSQYGPLTLIDLA